MTNCRNQHSKDISSYVGEVGRPLETPRDKALVALPMVLFALAIGFVVGALVCGLLTLTNALVRLVWVDGRAAAHVAWYPVAVCAGGGLLIGLWTRFAHPVPDSLESVMAQVRETGAYRLRSMPRAVVSFLLPLAFGGSVGPEAGLAGIVAAACTKAKELLVRVGVRAKSVVDLTVSATLSAVFGTPFIGAVAAAEGMNAGGEAESGSTAGSLTFRRPAKIVLYVAAAFGAFAGMQVVGIMPGASSGLPRFEAVSAQSADLLMFVPCLLVGWGLAVLYGLFELAGERIRERWGAHVILLPVACGLVLGLLALALPYALFSGEEQARTFMEAWAAGGASELQSTVQAVSAAGLGGAAALLLTAAAKAALTPLCLACGWRGGHFFPMIFAGVAAGFGVAALTGVDAMLCVTVTTATLMGAVMGRPLAAGALLLLCFPVSGVLWMGLAVLIGSALPRPAR